VRVINTQGKPVGEINMQGESAEKSVKFIVRGKVEDRSWVVTNTEEEPFNNIILGWVGGQILVPTSVGTRSLGLQVGGPGRRTVLGPRTVLGRRTVLGLE
jgi:hypothetical protein